MFEGSPPRLLPWTRPDGAPCYLITDDPESHLSLLADGIEEDMLAAAEAALNDSEATMAYLRKVLRDVVRVAFSRGERLAHAYGGTSRAVCEE
ncbi:hypothetical protein AB0C96_05010 [Streptomyces sp. NPDC048506]|uniref:hypothetical protein n=1 Tax=Streptomyces sp. NPDC048506 TaxID=3155028 RepID=UPI0034144F8F